MKSLASNSFAAALIATPRGASWRLFTLALGCAIAATASGQTPSTPEVSAPTPSGSAAPIEPRPFDGSLGGGLAEVRRLVDAGDTEGALEVAERLLAPDAVGRLRAWLERRSDGTSERALELFDGPLAAPLRALGFDPSTPAERAEVHFARGVVLRRAERVEDAEAAQRLARGLGGEARKDAVYELGHIAFVSGETWRAQIPELGGSQGPGAGAPPGAPAAGVAPAAGEDGPEPLEEARRAYVQALEMFVERLRLDWRDADTRANVELVRRRLRELDELERQREEQEQDQQDQGDDGDPKEDGEQKPSDDKEDSQQEDGQQDQPQDPESQTDPEDPNQQGEEPEPEEPSPEEEPGDPSAEEEPQPEDPEDAPQPSAEPQEGALTKEELQRLLQQLEARRERGAEVQQALRQRARGNSARDW